MSKLKYTITDESLTIVDNAGVCIRNSQDAGDLLMNAIFSGSNRVIIEEKHLEPAFFDLKTGIAGEILQKFSTYGGYLAIIGDFNKYSSKSLQDFIRESNKMGRIFFFADKKEALDVLS